MIALWLPATISDRVNNAKPEECMFDPTLNISFVVISATIGYHGSCIVMLFCYFKVFIFMHKRGRIRAAEGCAGIHKANVSVINTENKSTSGGCTRTEGTSRSTSLPCSPSGTPQPVLGSQEEQSATSSRHCDVNGQESIPVVQVQTDIQRRLKRDRAVFVTLSYVVVGYAVTWIPFHFAFTISSMCPTCIPRDVYEVVYWTSYCNSTLNPFLYYISTPEFRRAFKKMLCRK